MLNPGFWKKRNHTSTLKTQPSTIKPKQTHYQSLGGGGGGGHELNEFLKGQDIKKKWHIVHKNNCIIKKRLSGWYKQLHK